MTPRHARELLAVLIGGAVGTTLRLVVDASLPHSDDQFPLSTLIANTVGAFLLGLVVARLWTRIPVWLRAGLGAGLLGSFTTFSALAVSVVTLGDSGEWSTAVAYLVVTLALGFSAAAAGLTIGKGSARQAPLDEVDE